MKLGTTFSLLILAAFLGSGCASTTVAVAHINPTKGNACKGTITFTQKGEVVTIVADINGLKANGKHGFHIHEKGDCSAPDAKSAGGHYNPQGHEHGALHTWPRHAGDLGNLEADAKGYAHYEARVFNLSIQGAYNPILDRGVIVHAKEDNYDQPTGNAGARIGCGVIELKVDEPEPKPAKKKEKPAKKKDKPAKKKS
jgi:Cu-Zn family superoxide dismutase